MSTHQDAETRDANPGVLPVEPDAPTQQYQGTDRHHSDAAGMRREHGIPRWDSLEFEDYKSHVYPNLINHCYDGPNEGETRDKGGTDLLAVGKPGSGKSNLLLALGERTMECNDEKVVWRGSPSRSEWLPFAPWTRLCLPHGVDVRADLEPRDPREKAHRDIDLEDVVREVVRYRNPRHLNQQLLKPGVFHVVYPDPRMQGCQQLYEDSDTKAYDGLEFKPENPLCHWWFAWVLARVEHGPHHFTTLMADEIGDLAPQEAGKGEHDTLQKVNLLRDLFVDARKYGLSIFAAGHSETDLHDRVRRKFRWRCQMPGTANPTTASDVVGFKSVPMETDLTSAADPGEPLFYNERHFDEMSVGYIAPPFDHKLKVTMGVR